MEIKKPHNFSHRVGDWVFINVPHIAKYEWHPFTISSSPEKEDVLTFHIRGVGDWTNHLYGYFEEQLIKSAVERRKSIQSAKWYIISLIVGLMYYT